jgi:hypothetical protein
MAGGKIVRKLQLFTLHARTEAGPIDYLGLFNFVGGLGPTERARIVGGRMIALGPVRIEGNMVWLHAYEGDIKTDPMFLNVSSGEEHPGKLEPNDVLVQKTHVVIDTESRNVIVEFNGRGAKAHDIAELLQTIGSASPECQGLVLDFNPKVGEDFIREIERFGRIRVAELKLSRPNFDWTDHRNHLTDIASQSNGHVIDVSVYAARHESLAKNGGMVRYIKTLVRDPLSIFKGASVTGVREHEDAETSVSLARFIEHRNVRVRRAASGHVVDADIEGEMLEYLESVPPVGE